MLIYLIYTYIKLQCQLNKLWKMEINGPYVYYLCIWGAFWDHRCIFGVPSGHFFYLCAGSSSQRVFSFGPNKGSTAGIYVGIGSSLLLFKRMLWAYCQLYISVNSVLKSYLLSILDQFSCFDMDNIHLCSRALKLNFTSVPAFVPFRAVVLYFLFLGTGLAFYF